MERTGETFRGTWDIGNQTGLAIYGAKGNDWEGVWTYTGGREVGGEAWTRR